MPKKGVRKKRRLVRRATRKSRRSEVKRLARGVHHHVGILKKFWLELKKVGVHIEHGFMNELDELPKQITAALTRE